ncbi:hypothetical protein GCM10009730_25720 [Streptomyces albidochromogenes]
MIPASAAMAFMEACGPSRSTTRSAASSSSRRRRAAADLCCSSVCVVSMVFLPAQCDCVTPGKRNTKAVCRAAAVDMAYAPVTDSGYRK